MINTFVDKITVQRHCERSEAIQTLHCVSGLLRHFVPRNDGISHFTFHI